MTDFYCVETDAYSQIYDTLMNELPDEWNVVDSDSGLVLIGPYDEIEESRPIYLIRINNARVEVS